MRILVCNDDGIGAPGLLALADAARMLTTDVWVVAPERKWTAASHNSRSIEIFRLRKARAANTPAPGRRRIASSRQ